MTGVPVSSEDPWSPEAHKILELFAQLSLEEKRKIAPRLNEVVPVPDHLQEAPEPVASIFVRDESFFTEEGNSALLSRNDCIDVNTFGYHQHRIKSLITTLKLNNVEVKEDDLTCTEEFRRIFARDADRTVEKIWRREEYKKALTVIHQKLQDYHQGGGYVCAFLSIFLKTDELARIIWYLHESPNHHAGYYKAKPENFIKDAVTLYELLNIYLPELNAHLTKCGLVRDNVHMYCVKWFIGLGLHFMPFKQMFHFIEVFMYTGVEWLFKFSITYLRLLSSEIMEKKQLDQINSLIRNEDTGDHKKAHPHIKAYPEQNFFQCVFKDALEFDLNEKCNFKELRERTHQEYGEVLQKRKEKEEAMKAGESDDEIEFSDEEDN